MGFGGSAAAMIESIRNNARQLSKRNNYFERGVYEKYETSTKIIDYKKMPPDEFEVFKKRLRDKEVRRLKRLGIVFGSLMVIITAVLVFFLFFN